MNSHKHAGLTFKGRALLVSRVLDEGWKVARASEAAGVSERTGYKWPARLRAEGVAGLLTAVRGRAGDAQQRTLDSFITDLSRTRHHCVTRDLTSFTCRAKLAPV